MKSLTHEENQRGSKTYYDAVSAFFCFFEMLYGNMIEMP